MTDKTNTAGISDDVPDRLASQPTIALPTQEAIMARKRGRPKGARTRADTPGVRYARDYFELVGAGQSKGAAAKAVAAKWGVAVTTVLKARQRHERRLADEIIRQATDIEYRVGLMFANTYGRGTSGAEMRLIRAALSEAFSRLTQNCERLGAHAAAEAVRAFHREKTDRLFYQILGIGYRHLRRNIRNEAGG